MGDRTEFVPNHDGDLVLPCDPLFTRLLAVAHRRPQRHTIIDHNTGARKTTADLITDIIRLRRVLRAALPLPVLDDLRDGKEVYINVLAPGGYEFAVGILAVLALGAAASTISVAQPVSEAFYYASKARAVAVVASTTTLKLGRELQDQMRQAGNKSFTCVPISAFEEQQHVSIKDILISSNKYQDPNGAGIVIFTSGTTGPPKGAVLRRAAISDGALGFAEQICIESTSTILHLLPVHHATGIWVSFFPFILMGACIEFKSGSFDPAWTWERWKDGGITHFSGVPTIYMRMMRYYNDTLALLSATRTKAYSDAAANFKVMLCGTSALPEPISAFWTRMMNGRRIVQRYGGTETGVVFNMPFDGHEGIPDGSVGGPTLGVDVKLAPIDPDDQSVSKCPKDNADELEGEIHVRSFNMFSKYLHDPASTAASHTSEGYFRTGDIAVRRRSPSHTTNQPNYHYSIIGRASIDIIKSGGYKISALDLEREILSLPYIAEVMVVGVPDDEFGQRVAAAVVLRQDREAIDFWRRQGRVFCTGRDSSLVTTNNIASTAANDSATESRITGLTIDQLRDDARSRLAGYKLPTLLRVLDAEIPKSASGKVVKKILGPEYFPVPGYREDGEVQVWERQRAKL